MKGHIEYKGMDIYIDIEPKDTTYKYNAAIFNHGAFVSDIGTTKIDGRNDLIKRCKRRIDDVLTKGNRMYNQLVENAK